MKLVGLAGYNPTGCACGQTENGSGLSNKAWGWIMVGTVALIGVGLFVYDRKVMG